MLPLKMSTYWPQLILSSHSPTRCSSQFLQTPNQRLAGCKLRVDLYILYSVGHSRRVGKLRLGRTAICSVVVAVVAEGRRCVLVGSGTHGRGKRGFGSQHGHCSMTKVGVKEGMRKRRRWAIASLSAWTRNFERVMSFAGLTGAVL
jgi:hypothetical protein